MSQELGLELLEAMLVFVQDLNEEGQEMDETVSDESKGRFSGM